MDSQTTKTILIDVQLKADAITAELPALAGEVARLTAAQAALKKEGQQGTAAFQKQAQDLRELSGQYREANKYIDNVAKARNAENNSITQNRALLSALTADYVKLNQEVGKTDPATQKAATAINNLTEKLKDQEKQIGQTYRNVGNYADSLGGLAQQVGSSIPGFSQFSTVLTSTVQNFSALGTGAAEGGVALEGMAVAGGVLIGVFAGLVVGAVAFGNYLSNFAQFSDTFEKSNSRLGSGVKSFFNSIKNGDWGNFIKNIKESGDNAEFATGRLIELGRESLNSQTLTADEDAKVSLLMKTMRDKTTSAMDAEKAYQQILKLTGGQHERNHEIAKSAYLNLVGLATAHLHLQKDEINSISDLNLGYEKLLQNAKNLLSDDVVGKDILEKMNPALQAIIQIDSKKAQADQLAKNRDDSKAAKDAQRADKERALQEQITRSIEAANSERLASYQRSVESQQEVFGKELSQTDEHFRQLIFKQQQFIEKQEQIAHDKKHDAKTRGLAGKAAGAGRADIKQLTAEKNAVLEKMLVEHNRAMAEETAKAALDLQSIQIQSIRNAQERELAGIEVQDAIKKQALAKENSLVEENIRKLNAELTDKTKTKSEVFALKATLDEQYAILGDNADKTKTLEKQKQQAIGDTNKKYHDQNQAVLDQNAILQAGLKGGNNNPFNKAQESAEVNASKDKIQAVLDDDKTTDAQRILAVTEFETQRKAIEDKFRNGRMDLETKGFQAVANAGFKIIGEGIKSQAQATEVQLSKSKEKELSNTSLTSAQKLAINEKYRVLEGQAKVKEFKQNQKLQIGQALINGAVGISKTIGEMGFVPAIPFVALTAAEIAMQVATIASQKPPAYAQGGFHSDGKGALLPGYSRTDNTNAYLRSGEAVVVSEAMQDPYARNLVSAINVAYGGRDFSTSGTGRGFAVGGIFTDGGNSNRYYAQPAINNENLANTIAFQLINNFPPIYTNVNDINYQQGIKAQTLDRVNI